MSFKADRVEAKREDAAASFDADAPGTFIFRQVSLPRIRLLPWSEYTGVRS